jgi:hypothetical protein
MGETSKPGLISQSRNQWNLRRRLNQEAWFPINLMLKNEIEKKTI